MTQLAQPLEAVDSLIRRVSQRRQEHRVGFDHVGGAIPLPRADVSTLNHHLRAALVTSRSLPFANLGGHVGLDAYPSLESAFLVLQRAGVGIEPPLPAVLAADEDLEADAAPGCECAANTADRLGIGAGEIQQIAGSAARGLSRRIAGHLSETVVDPDDAALRIVDGHAVAGDLADEGDPVESGLGRDFPH